MGTLSSDLKNMGYERTAKESPFEDGAALWTDGTELVCDETGIVLRSDDAVVNGGDDAGDRDYFRYPNSGIVRMVGGYFRGYLEGDGIYGED